MEMIEQSEGRGKEKIKRKEKKRMRRSTSVVAVGLRGVGLADKLIVEDSVEHYNK